MCSSCINTTSPEIICIIWLLTVYVVPCNMHDQLEINASLAICKPSPTMFCISFNLAISNPAIIAHWGYYAIVDNFTTHVTGHTGNVWCRWWTCNNFDGHNGDANYKFMEYILILYFVFLLQAQVCLCRNVNFHLQQHFTKKQCSGKFQMNY